MSSEQVIQSQLNKIRKNKFLVVLTIPNILKTINSKIRKNEFINLDSMQFSVYNIKIPASSIPAHSLHYGQQNYNVSSFDRPPYPPVSINFEVDNEFKNYWLVWKWLQLLNDEKDASYAGSEIFENGKPKQVPENMMEYSTVITIYALDEYNKKKIKFKFNYAFPTELGELDFSLRESDQLTCSFTFVFNQILIDLINEEIPE